MKRGDIEALIVAVALLAVIALLLAVGTNDGGGTVRAAGTPSEQIESAAATRPDLCRKLAEAEAVFSPGTLESFVIGYYGPPKHGVTAEQAFSAIVRGCRWPR